MYQQLRAFEGPRQVGLCCALVWHWSVVGVLDDAVEKALTLQ